MEFGARNKVLATVKSVKAGEVMALIKFDVEKPCEMASVITAESRESLGRKPGDEVELVIKAVHVLPVRK